MYRTLIGAAALVFVASSTVWAADGAQIFKANCAKCHGETGTSDTAVGKAMKVPHLAGDANIASLSDADLAAKIKAQPKHPGTIKGLSEADLTAVAGYIKTLGK